MSDQRPMLCAPSRARISAYLTVVLFAWLALGCGSDLPEQPSYVSPVYEQSCDGFDCSGVGTCAIPDETNDVHCKCPSGYAGVHCEGCASGFHRDALWHCVPDRRCADQPANPCGSHGDCDDDAGVIACACTDGYQGARCNVCVDDYVKSDKGLCTKKAVEQ